MAKQTVVVWVSGGVAEVVAQDCPVDVDIVDMDNIEATDDDDALVSMWQSFSEFTRKYIEQEDPDTYEIFANAEIRSAR